MNKNGVGLGLVIAKQICQQFDGDITIESEVGVGTTFTYQFKLESMNELEQEDQINEAQVTAIQANSKNLIFNWEPFNQIHDIKYA